MIYLASVYSFDANTDSEEHKDKRQRRYEYAVQRLYGYLNAGLIVFSPIVHCHNVATEYELPNDYEYWQKMDRAMIRLCDAVHVLKMPNWEYSRGVTDEILYAKSLGKPVRYIICPDYSADYDNGVRHDG